MTIELNEQNFAQEIEESKGVSLVDFSAEWCGPCQAMKPILENLSEEVGCEFKIAKIDIDQIRGVASRFNIMSVPTFIFFKDGKEMERMSGMMSKEILLEKLKSL